MDRSDLEVRYHCRKLDVHLLRKPEHVLFWLCGTFFSLSNLLIAVQLQSYVTVKLDLLSPTLSAADTASNLPKVTLN